VATTKRPLGGLFKKPPKAACDRSHGREPVERTVPQEWSPRSGRLKDALEMNANQDRPDYEAVALRAASTGITPDLIVKCSN